MAKLIHSTTASLDGCVTDRRGSIAWTAPDAEVLSFWTNLLRPMGAHLYGRRMYETMVYRETAGQSDDPPATREFADLWRAVDKIVYSRTLPAPASARTRLERAFSPAAIQQLKRAAVQDISIGGAQLAGEALAAGLVDECRLLLRPITVGGGKRALPAAVRLELDLADERRFRSGCVYLRYRVRP